MSGVPENSLTQVAKITGVDPLSLKKELCCFARNFTVLSRSLPDEFEGASDDAVTMTSTSEEESSEEESSVIMKTAVSARIQYEEIEMLLAKETVKSVLHAVTKFSSSTHSTLQPLTNLFVVYEHLLTLPFTQVSCERAFSKLKQIKTRLRSNLANDKLETVGLMLLTSGEDLLDNITVHHIIAILEKGSSVLRQMLATK